MISIENIAVEFGTRILFDNVSFIINKKERMALTGRNGAGKSTLLALLAGIDPPTKGTIARPKDLTVGYLPQQMKFANSLSVREEAAAAFNFIRTKEKELERIHQLLSDTKDYNTAACIDLMAKADNLQEQIRILGGNHYMAEVEKALLGLGFERSDMDRNAAEFSGGWRMRIELAKILLRRPDVLLLDEPTNHLDIESIVWLEQFIVNRSNAVVVVSHDRMFLDRVTSRTLEIDMGRIYDYKVPYSDFLSLREQRREQQLRAMNNELKKREATIQFIERFRYKATKAVQVQSRIRQLEKAEKNTELFDLEETDSRAINITFNTAPMSGAWPVTIENLTKSYGDRIVFHNLNLAIARGEKIALTGKNGAGKSTLIKCIMGETPFDGSLRLGHNVQTGYFAQNQAQLLNEESTVFETIDAVATGEIRTRIRHLLGAFLFSADDMEKKVKVLSGGERSRLAMIQLLLRPVNLLILDEPTNHLDMRSKEVLKEALKRFTGTVIVVSHDRDFLIGLVDKVYHFNNRQLTESHLMIRYEEHNLPADDTGSRNAGPVGQSLSLNTPYEEMKERKKTVRKAEKEIEETEQRISRLENELADIQNTMQSAQTSLNESIYTRYATVKEELETALSLWTEQAAALDKLRQGD